MKKFLIYIFGIFVLLGCDKDFNNRCFEKSGAIGEERRELEPFQSILVFGMFDIELVFDTAEYVIVKCGENLFPYIETIQQGVNLNLYNNINCEWSREYYIPKLTIHLKKLTYFQNQETCNLYNNDTLFTNNIILYLRSELAEMNLNIIANEIKCWGSHNTSGKYNLSGECKDLIVDAHNAIEFDFSELKAKTAYVNHNSIGNIDLNVSQYLNAKIMYSGNIRLFGNTDTINIEEQKGTGKIILVQ